MGGHHVFIAVEAGQSSKGLDWEAVRQNVAATGGYLSLALLNGARSNWVVRPVPAADQIPLRVSTSRAGTAAPGIAAAVIDQLMEAHGLVPAIQTTEVRLYGGTLAETELNAALSGDKTIQLRVFDKGGLRTARPGKAAPVPLVATLKPVRTSGPSLVTAQQRTGTGASPKTPQPMKSNPKSTAGRVVGAGQGLAPSHQPPTGTRGKAASPSGGSPTTANPQAQREAFGTRYHPGRRFVAAILAAATVLIGVFPGFVWAHIWGYSYPGDAGLIADAISFAQSRAFGASMVFGALVALVGTRVRWLALLGFGYGVASGVMPAVTPEFLDWTAPQPIYGLLVNTDGFWGEWTAWAPLIYIGGGLWLCRAVSRVLPKTPKHVLEARKRIRQSTQHFFGQRSPIDIVVVRWLIGLGLTGVGPWIIGRFLLQDNFMYTASPEVFDKSARAFWPYVPTLYLGGLAALLLIGGLAMLLQPWVGRIGAGLAGLALVATSFVVGSFGTSLWQAQENVTAERMVATAFPFQDSFYSCGHAEASLKDASGKSWLYQVWSARIKGSQVAGDACNRVIIYQGWKQLRTDDLPTGQTITGTPEFVSGQTSEHAIFQYGKSDGSKVQLKLSGVGQ